MPQPPSLPRVQHDARTLCDAGDLAGARRLLTQAIAAARPAYGPDHPDLLTSAHLLAQLHRRADDPAAARRVLEEALADGQRRHGDDHPVLLAISHELGSVAEELGNRHEARRNFTRVATYGPAVLGADHPAVREARAYLGDGVPDPAGPVTGTSATGAFGSPPPISPAPFTAAPPTPAPPTPAPPTPAPPTAAPTVGAYPPPIATTGQPAPTGYAAPPPNPGYHPPQPATTGYPVQTGNTGYPGTAYPSAPPPPSAGDGRGWPAAVIAVAAAVVAIVAAGVVAVVVLTNRSGPSGPVPTSEPTTAAFVGAAPTDLRLRDGGTTITVTWTDPSAGTVPFIVAGGRAGQTLGALASVDAGRTSYTVNGLSAEVEYCFTVLAVYGTDRYATSGQVCTTRHSASPR